MNQLPPEVVGLVDTVMSLCGSYPVLIAGVACLAWAAVKKLVKLGVFAGICLLVWLMASNYGVQLPI